MTVIRSTVGTFDDRDLTSFRIDNGALRLDVCDFGATLVRLQMPRDASSGLDESEWIDVVLHHRTVDGYTNPSDRAGYLGATIGRVANRIGKSQFELDGHTFGLTANEGGNHLHGGEVGFDQRLWAAHIGDDSVTFSLVSPAGDQGYPGRLTATVEYRLAGSTLAISYTATTDAPTIVNMTNHAYWNLAGAGTIADHTLRVNADHYLPLDHEQIPTGAIATVEDTRFDLRRETPLDGVLTAGGLDTCYLVPPFPSRAPRDVTEVAKLCHPASGRTMVVATDQPAVQVYTANHLPAPQTAICLETQLPPNAPNAPQFGDIVLRPGATYRHRTLHTFAMLDS